MRTFVSALTVAFLLAGCGQKPEFVHTSEFEELEPYAREYVQQVLETYFGSPYDMVVWDRLPVETHLATGTVTSASDRELTVDLAEPHQPIAPGTEVLWIGGELEGEPSGWVHQWDESQHLAQLESRLPTLPAEGQPVIFGPGGVLTKGRVLYAEHCQHCHGVTGDGNGPTAPYLNPKPRDYRRGIFKFTSTHANERASRDDLARIIEEGIPGTYMPSFKLLTDEEMTSIVEYIMWLTMRGEVEYQLVRYLADGYSQSAVRDRTADGESYDEIKQEFLDAIETDIQEEFDELIVDLMVTRWESAQQPAAVIVPQEKRVPYTEESIARGRKLYRSADLACNACHGDAGYGDGPQTYSITKNQITGEDNPEPGLFDNWGNKLEPRNLHAGVFRGGRRPIDLYARVHAGIKGTPMPAFGAKLSDEQIWDIVNYIYSVPFEDVVPGDGAREVPAETSAPPEEVATN